MVLSIFLKPRYMLGVQCVIMIISSTLLTLYWHQVPEVLWVCTCLKGKASTVAWGNGLAWAHQNLHVNVVAIMFFFIALGLGSTSFLYIVGTFFDENPHYFGYVMVMSVTGLSVSFIFMEAIATLRRRRAMNFSLPHSTWDE